MSVEPKHIVNLQGREYVLFIGVLGHAHSSGLESVETELLQIPTAENGNMAIVKAMAWFRNSENERLLWVAHGDASNASTKGPIQNAVIRMAETRAIGRVLRMATNLGITMLEELGGEDDAPHANGKAGSAGASVVSHPVRPAASAQGSAAAAHSVCTWPGCETELTKNQVTMSQHHTKRDLCVVHMNEARAGQTA